MTTTRRPKELSPAVRIAKSLAARSRRKRVRALALPREVKKWARLYEEMHYSIRMVAETFHVPYSTVRTAFKAHQIEMRRSGPYKGGGKEPLLLLAELHRDVKELQRVTSIIIRKLDTDEYWRSRGIETTKPNET